MMKRHFEKRRWLLWWWWDSGPMDLNKATSSTWYVCSLSQISRRQWSISSYFFIFSHETDKLRGSHVFWCIEAHDESCSIRSGWRLLDTKANSKSTSCLAGGFNDLHPSLGKIPMFTNIFQLSWNHQLVVYIIFSHMCVWSLSQQWIHTYNVDGDLECGYLQASKMPQRVDRWMLSVGEPSRNSRHEDYYMFCRRSL